MLTETEINEEIKIYKAFSKAVDNAKTKNEGPSAPENIDDQKSKFRFWLGILLMPAISLSLFFSKIFRLHKLRERLARLRIKADIFSYEPVSCGLNAAYTELGLALLAQGKLPEAIECLDLSWKVHPCPHNTTFGLRRGLVARLKEFPDASQSVNQYIRMGKRFNLRPKNWEKKIYN